MTAQAQSTDLRRFPDRQSDLGIVDAGNYTKINDRIICSIPKHGSYGAFENCGGRTLCALGGNINEKQKGSFIYELTQTYRDTTDWFFLPSSDQLRYKCTGSFLHFLIDQLGAEEIGRWPNKYHEPCDMVLFHLTILRNEALFKWVTAYWTGGTGVRAGYSSHSPVIQYVPNWWIAEQQEVAREPVKPKFVTPPAKSKPLIHIDPPEPVGWPRAQDVVEWVAIDPQMQEILKPRAKSRPDRPFHPLLNIS